ncbi:MAG: lumenal Hsp70 protein [Phylliscum demangeonii]|nr:MAG: lumenal Hsp70 protein [Phylliscum demangeonii]
MASPSRRRRPPFTPAILLLLLLSATVSVASSVLGIDLGTEYIKAVLVKPGIPLEIVLTKDSKRKETASVAFKAVPNAPPYSFPERIYGSDAMALSARIPADVYPNLKALLGLPITDPVVVSEYRQRHPLLQLVPLEGRGTVAFQSGTLAGDQGIFPVEELLAMELQNIRSNVEAMAGKGHSVKDAVLTVPPFYTAEELRAVELAAELAGLNLLGLVSDGLAVGINYATSRTFPSVSEGAMPEYHLIYDMGAGYTSATVLQFQGRTVKDVGKFNKTIQEVNALSTAWDRTLGGDFMNGLIVDHMVEEFCNTPAAKKHGFAPEAVKAHGRTAAKLWKEAERARQILSANSETVVSFEDLFEEVDFRYKLSRGRFEELASSLAERVEEPARRALDAAQLTMADLDSLILHGGATRTPFLQERLEKLIGDAGKIRSNVNADEAAVFGAAFMGAGRSPSFRVKEIRSRDAGPYAIGMRWTSNGKGILSETDLIQHHKLTDHTDRRQRLFLPTEPRGVEKHVPFQLRQDFSFALYHQVASDVSSAGANDVQISDVQTRNLTASVAQLLSKAGCAERNVTVSFTFRLRTIDGLPEVVRGVASCDIDLSEKKGGVVDDVKGFFGFGSKTEEQTPLEDPASEEPGSPPSKNADQAASSIVAESKTATPEASGKSKALLRPKKRSETVHVEFTVSQAGTPPFSAASLKKSKERLSAFHDSDRSRRLREESLNSLEAFIYRSRDLLDDEIFITASTEEERGALQVKIQEASDWLYGEGADAGRQELGERLKGLKSLVNPVKRRIEEANRRPQEIVQLRKVLNQTKTLIDVVVSDIEKGEAAKAASVVAEEANPQTSSESTSTQDESAGLEDSTSSASSASTTTIPSAVPDPPLYTAEDVASLTSAYESADTWLNAKLAEQATLSAHDDPVVLAKEIEAKSSELNKAVLETLQKKLRAIPKAKTSTRAKSKTQKAKTKSSSTSATPPAQENGGPAEEGASTQSSAASSSTGKGEEGAPKDAAEGKTGKKHDEL